MAKYDRNEWKATVNSGSCRRNTLPLMELKMILPVKQGLHKQQRRLGFVALNRLDYFKYYLGGIWTTHEIGFNSTSLGQGAMQHYHICFMDAKN